MRNAIRGRRPIAIYPFLHPEKATAIRRELVSHANFWHREDSQVDAAFRAAAGAVGDEAVYGTDADKQRGSTNVYLQGRATPLAEPGGSYRRWALRLHACRASPDCANAHPTLLAFDSFLGSYARPRRRQQPTKLAS